jgi:hypothetical protein
MNQRMTLSALMARPSVSKTKARLFGDFEVTVGIVSAALASVKGTGGIQSPPEQGAEVRLLRQSGPPAPEMHRLTASF